MEICSKCKRPIKKHTGRPRTIDHEQVVNLHRKGLSVEEIVDELKCSYRSVKRIIKALCKPEQVNNV